MQPAVFDRFRGDERGNNHIKFLRVGELREQLRLQTKLEFSSGALSVTPWCGACWTETGDLSGGQRLSVCHKRFCVYSEARV